ncbi:glycosyltransferase [Arthrobacter roseus]|uniref:glycosyltransferase n=1 Tax=Arthrobacter roseus TaxID=136274 RepID=UPI001965D5D8|nr:glycosyltransferase [Arthrobacter roseus]MBM7849021.1 rhamnopyranosyl-N-acetylglucosaminyl-diphospho-decaprenol beta-1,3/1,4-galactofuranosyltransferase [Arthrobacter roseus]
MLDSVAVAAVTFDRPDDARTLLESLHTQSHRIFSVSLVDSGTKAVRAIAENAAAPVQYIRSETNLGGAGGFCLAILSAMASGAQWIWIMDDDAHPEDPECLGDLLEAAKSRQLDVVLPLVVAPEDHTRLSFPFRLNGHLTHDRATVEKQAFLPDIGQFFNGALIRRDVFFRVGLPDLRLFIRGDETDFMLRLRKSGIPFGTYTGTALSHPPGWGEVQELLGDRMHVLVPETAFKRFFYFRNRGYLLRRYRRPRSLIADLTGYPLYYLKKRDLSGLRQWFAAYSAGVRGIRFGPPTDQGF